MYDMSEESRTNSPSEDQKESYLYATSGHPIGQDTNPPEMPATRHGPSCDCKEDVYGDCNSYCK